MADFKMLELVVSYDLLDKQVKDTRLPLGLRIWSQTERDAVERIILQRSIRYEPNAN
jgi:hypothetical protein